MSNTTKKLIAGLLMAATTFTASSTCFANQVGFFNDGTGCETAQCYKDLTDKMCIGNDVLCKKLRKTALENIYETEVREMYPEVVQSLERLNLCSDVCSTEGLNNLESLAYAELAFEKDLSKTTNKEELIKKMRAFLAIPNFLENCDGLDSKLDNECARAYWKKFEEANEVEFEKFHEWLNKYADLFGSKVEYDILKSHEDLLVPKNGEKYENCPVKNTGDFLSKSISGKVSADLEEFKNELVKLKAEIEKIKASEPQSTLNEQSIEKTTAKFATYMKQLLTKCFLPFKQNTKDEVASGKKDNKCLTAGATTATCFANEDYAAA